MTENFHALSTTQATRSARRWWIALAAVLAVALALALGRWQLSRAAQKEALQATISERKMLAALDNKDLLAIDFDADMLHRQVRLEGRWLPQYTLYLDNRPRQGQPGFWVLTPLQLRNSAQVIVVQRGWLPRNFLDRTVLPPLTTPTGVVRVQGRVALPPSKLLELGAATPGPGSRSSSVRQNIDLAEFRSTSQLPLADWVLLQTDAASEGLLRDWAQAGSGVEKNYGYAFQWFGLAGLITLLYVWFQIVRRFYPAHRPDASPQ